VPKNLPKPSTKAKFNKPQLLFIEGSHGRIYARRVNGKQKILFGWFRELANV
jgi:hypothetical protein